LQAGQSGQDGDGHGRGGQPPASTGVQGMSHGGTSSSSDDHQLNLEARDGKIGCQGGPVGFQMFPTSPYVCHRGSGVSALGEGLGTFRLTPSLE
jgi:hypothetical protein